MANPAELTITEFTKNGQTANPSAQSIDTDGTVPVNAGGKTDRLVIQVTNNAAANLQVTIQAADNPPGLQSKSLVSSAIAQNAVAWFGPFESSRFIKSGANAGELNVEFLAASSTPNASVRVFRLPKV